MERISGTLFFLRRKPKSTGDAQQSSSPSTIAIAERPTPRGESVARDHHHPPAPHAGAPHDTQSLPARRQRSRGRRGSGRGETNPQGTPRAATTSLPEPLIDLPEAFRALGIDETGLRAVAALGFERPTPIQTESLPILLDGEDVVGLAQTGTGKTLAFGLPLSRTIDPATNEVQALVLVPTRELANQVREVMEHLGKFYGFVTIGLVGGRRVQSDLVALERGAHVVVGTPGRVIDHLKRGTLSLRNVRFAVLDEADQMLDIGFARDIDYILRVTPKERQTALFSATMPESIGRLVYRYMRGARRLSVTPEQRTAEGVKQMYCEVAERDKILALRYLYEEMDLGRSLIFRRTKVGVDRLTEQLQRAGLPAKAIHGDLRQGERDRVMADFRAGTLQFLIATNVAARGLDIPDIEHVINYDVPQNAEEYIHRVGRTARWGKTGSAVTFVGEWELGEWDTIVRVVGSDDIEHLRLPAQLH